MATTATDYEKEMFSGVSSASVHAATGRTWDEWLEVLDAAQALQLDHKGIVAHLEREYPEVSAWWQQSIAVGYERARGIRVVGQTADAGFQVGVQRSVAAPKPAVWELVVSHPELWLGDAAQVVLAEGTRYELPGSGDASGVRGEIRVVRPEQRPSVPVRRHKAEGLRVHRRSRRRLRDRR